MIEATFQPAGKRILFCRFVMGMGFLDRASANRHVIVVFSLAVVVALWVIAIQDNPFRGAVQVSPEAIEQAVSTCRD